MTASARTVLADCEFALSLLEEETDARKWRILWAAAVALARAVGHVLNKVDGRNPVCREVSNEFHRSWKIAEEHEIFRDFIEHERNNLLKEYSSDVHPLTEASVFIQLSAVGQSDGMPQNFQNIFEIGENIYRPMLSGPWEGTDCRDVLCDAIKRWKAQLDAIEVEVRHRGNVRTRK